LIVSQLSFAESQGPSPGPPELNQEQQDKTPPKQGLSNNNKQSPKKSSPGIPKIETQTRNPEKATDTAHGNEKSSNDWTFVDVALTIFNGLLVIFTFLLWRSTRGLWQAAQHSDRPYIFVTVKGDIREKVQDVTVRHSGPATSPLGEVITSKAGEVWVCHCEYTLENQGKTPAILNNIICEIWWGSVNDPLPSIDEPKEDWIPPGGAVIAAGDNKSFTKERPIMNEPEVGNIAAGYLKLLCYGWVGYKDIFGISHYTKFAWEFQNRVDEKGFYLSPSKELNDYT
jgi:hypothetical protein